MEPKEEKKALSAYSLLDNRVQSDPYEFYSLLHEKCPIYQMPETGIYVVTKYEDVRAILLDTETFSSVVLGMSALQGPNAELYQQILANAAGSMFTSCTAAIRPSILTTASSSTVSSR